MPNLASTEVGQTLAYRLPGRCSEEPPHIAISAFIASAHGTQNHTSCRIVNRVNDSEIPYSDSVNVRLKPDRTARSGIIAQTIQRCFYPLIIRIR